MPKPDAYVRAARETVVLIRDVWVLRRPIIREAKALGWRRSIAELKRGYRGGND